MSAKPLVLIVDDVPDNVHVLGRCLSSVYEVQFATSGAQALAFVRHYCPDLVFLDVQMPEMDGYEVFARIKRMDGAVARTPVIFVTAMNDPTSEAEALNAGAADFIHKPVNPIVARARARQQLELHFLRDRLERTVLRRTRELAVARTEAETASIVKTQFMKNLSHEMRTPLTGVLGFAQIGRTQSIKLTQEGLAAMFGHVVVSGERMAKLVDSLLLLSEKADEDEKINYQRQLRQIEAAAFFRESIEASRAAALARHQHIHFECQAEAILFEADSERLTLVFDHVLANAMQYSPEGSDITVRVEQTFLPRASGRVAGVLVQIIDQGCGIPDAEVAAVFEPFYQSSRTKTGAGGTGLGLPLSRCIVERHGGMMSVTNRQEGGVMVEILLPLVVERITPLIWK